MKKFLALSILIFTATATQLGAQNSAAAAESTKPSATSAQSQPTLPAKGATDQPIKTEIYSDQAFFDTSKRIGTFTGHVKVNDPRFNIQSDKLTVFIQKDENEGLEKAVAEGNVGVVRDKPDPKGGPPSRSVGLSRTAIYTASDGNIELTGDPRVQQGMNTHVATSPNTVMILNQNGQLVTKGPSRTEIRQQPKGEQARNEAPRQ